MKTLALTATIIAALAAPALAQHNPAAQTIFLSEATSDDELTFAPRPGGPEILSSQSFGTNAAAARIFAAENAAGREDE